MPARSEATLHPLTDTRAPLETTDADYRAAFHGANDAILIQDIRTGAILDANLKACEMFGLDVQELRRLNVSRLSAGPPYTPDKAMRRIEQAALDRPQVFEWQFRNSSGQIFWVEVSLKSIVIGGCQRLIAIVRDIRHRKLLEQRLLSLNRLREALLKPGTLSEKLKLVTDGIVEIFDADFARIWIAAPGDRCNSGCLHARFKGHPHGCQSRDRCLHLMASSGRYTHTNGAVHGRIPMGAYKVGRIAAGLETDFLTNNTAGDPNIHHHRWARRLGLVSLAAHPVLSADGQSVGVLALFSRHPISPDESALIEGLAGTTAQVILTISAEAARQSSEDQYRLVVDNANEGIFVVQDGVIQFANPITSRLMDYSPEEFSTKPFAEMIHPEDRDGVVARYLRRLAGENIPGVFPFRVFNKEGGVLWIEINSVRILWGGRPATLNFARDVTFQKRLEEQLLQAQKMEGVGRLAGGLAHDFNNLLTAILGFSDLMLAKLGTDEPLRRNVEEIDKAGKRAADLIRQLLAFSRKQVLRPRVIDLNKLVSAIEQMLLRLIGEDIQLNILLDPGLALIKADPHQIEQVLVNLAVNARDAMPKGGRLTIETANVHIEDAHHPPEQELGADHYVSLSVSDTGVGIDEECLPRIFEPFYTTKEAGRGTGLGLSTVYGIVKQSGGGITVFSELGKGTTFRICLPKALETE